MSLDRFEIAVVLNGTKIEVKNSGGLLSKTLPKDTWTRVALDVNAATGEVGLDVNGRSATTMGPGAVTAANLGILANGNGTTDLQLDDVVIQY